MKYTGLEVVWLATLTLISSASATNVIKERSVACTAPNFDNLAKALVAVEFLKRPDLMPSGCIVLRPGLSVRGPLNIVKSPDRGDRDRLALIDIPGKGTKWTFLNALRDQRLPPPQTGRFANKLDVDTLGCLTVDLLNKAIDELARKRQMPKGCIDLNEDGRGLPVFGPLEIAKNGWALIEVPGKGKLWTFLAHLKDRHGN